MLVKFCGIRRNEDIVLMNRFLPDYIGFVFAKSKRQITVSMAAELGKELHHPIKKVGVFVNEELDEIVHIAKVARLDVIQLHGEESQEMIEKLRNKALNIEIWKAVRVKSQEDIKRADKLDVDRILYDSFSPVAHGGTGTVIDTKLIQAADNKRGFFVAGGLNAQNLENIIREIRPWGIDLSSGIEVNGYKSQEKIEEIVRCIKCIQKEDLDNLVVNTSLRL